MAFIAAIRRVPGGSFVKAPKSQNFTAVPVQTTLSNLYTYFDAWPKRSSEFLLYGSRRPYSTSPCDSPPRNLHQPKPPGALGAGAGGGDGTHGAEHLYGPNLSAPQPAPGNSESAVMAAAAAAAAAA
eukprot:CAMPEP_0115526322 /NCGR_PEP_ID=MMETSP0271-20121206/82235_1 /TAXON_ID=71861 /ORGANISM="Scrippsiella trochoidea, Strain CCMP3099" /LENGTH=126 /DNA_ID=CAMNT_0002958047 /DNA_START=44 /DNA_END=420 /DNA_ORIENTATION=-